MKKLFLLICTSFILFACSKGEDEPSVPEKEQALVTAWAYLVADNTLKTDLRNNIKMMYEGLSNMEKQATLLVYWDGGSSDSYLAASPCIIKYTTDGYGNINGIPARDSSYTTRFISEQGVIVKEYNSHLSVDKDVMTSILKDLNSFSPTDKIALLAGSHGSAWTHSISPKVRSFGQDGTGTDNTITTSDMAKAITNAGIKLDLLLFDACLMGTVEVCYDFRNAVNYLIASAIEAPGPGIPYNEIMEDIYAGTVDSYTNICKKEIAHYAKRTDGYDWSTMALISCSQTIQLAELVKEQLMANKDKLYNYNPIPTLQQYGINKRYEDDGLSNNFYYVSFDLIQFIKELNDNVLPSNFSTQFSKTVLYADCLENSRNYPVKKSNFCGIGMYIPVSVRPAWNTYFKTIDWYTAAGWDQISFSWGF